MGRQRDGFPSFSHASKVIATLSKNKQRKKIQPSSADSTAKQVVQNHEGGGEKPPFGDFDIRCKTVWERMLLNTHHFPSNTLRSIIKRDF